MKKILVGLILVSFIASGCTVNNSKKSSIEKNNQNSVSEKTLFNSNEINKEESFITMDEAEKIALDYYDLSNQDIHIEKKEYDYEDRRKTYEFDIISNTTEYEVTVDARDGSILEASKEEKKNVTLKNESKSTITIEEAEQIAIKHFSLNNKDINFVKKEIDFDDGKNVYEFEIISGKNEYEITINSDNGSILEAEVNHID